MIPCISYFSPLSLPLSPPYKCYILIIKKLIEFCMKIYCSDILFYFFYFQLQHLKTSVVVNAGVDDMDVAPADDNDDYDLLFNSFNSIFSYFFSSLCNCCPFHSIYSFIVKQFCRKFYVYLKMLTGKSK